MMQNNNNRIVSTLSTLSMAVFFVLIALIILMFMGCKLDGDSDPQNNVINASIAFRDRNDTDAREITLTPSESLQALSDFYANAGTLVGTYTPTTFKLFIQGIVLYNETEAVELDVPLSSESASDPSRHCADFIEDIVIQPEGGVPPGTYTGMFFFFFAVNSVMGSGGTPDNPEYFIEIEPSIVVEIPGYEGVWPDNQYTDDRYPGFNPYNVQDLGGGKYHFTLQVIQPGNWSNIMEKYLSITGSEDDETIQRIEQFAYIKNSPYRAILPGVNGHPDIWDTGDADTLGLPNHGSTGNASAIIMPFDGITIPETADSVSFTVAWDLDNIIEVYDADTPADKSDDVVVLAQNFWERFSLIPEVVESDSSSTTSNTSGYY